MSEPVRNLVPLARPLLGDAEVAAAERVIRSGWVTQGPEVAAFENEFAAAVGAAHAVAVSNCTVALEVALRALNIGRGDEVVTVSHSFVATANAVVATGAHPRFVDVKRSTLGIDPAQIERAITPKTRAILAVHQIGIPCDLASVIEIATRHHLPVVEDAACAAGSEIEWNGKWERIGRPHGVIACFSFHPRKVVTTGDGGMLTTADAKLAERFRLLRQHGMSVPDTVRHAATEIVIEQYVEPAFNFRMTDIQAAVGRPQLARLEAAVAERRRIAEIYGRALAANRLLASPTPPAWGRTNWQSYPVFIRDRSPLDQLAIIRFLLDRGVASKPGITNAHREPAYRNRPEIWSCSTSDCMRGDCPHLPQSDWLREHVIFLPIFHGMTENDIGQVTSVLEELDRTAEART